MIQHISALEHQTLGVTAGGSDSTLSFAEADALMLLSQNRRGFCERRYHGVRLAQYCGVVNLGNRMLEVVPKVGDAAGASEGRAVLLRLLRASAAHDGFRSLPATQHLERLPLLEIFVALFMDAVTVLVRGGLLRQYRIREEDLRVVRGQIVLSRQFGVHFNRVDVVASRFDDHTADNIWNRAVKAALRAVRPWIVNGDLQRRWVELHAAMEDVGDVPVSAQDVDRLTFDRQAARYAPVIDWVRWILKLLSPTLRAGAEKAPSFLFDMNRVFENAIANTLRMRLEAVDSRVTVSQQVRGRFLARHQNSGRRAFALKPDITVSYGSRLHLIADTKWKEPHAIASGTLKPSRADMYQMHAYASAFNIDRLVLIYPAYEDLNSMQAGSFELPGPRGKRPVVSVACVDVHRDELPFTIGGDALLNRSQLT